MLSLTLLVAAGQALAEAPTHTPQEIENAVLSPLREAEIERLLAVTPLLPTRTLIAEVNALLARADWPLALRESILYGYARSMRDLAPQAHVYEVLGQLAGYRARVLVPHPDSELHGIPAFNIAAVATGTRNAWDAELTRGRAADALARGEVAYFESLARRPLSNAQLTGLNQALGVASKEQVHGVSNGLHAILRDRPEASHLALTATSVTGEPEPIRVLLASAHAGQAVSVLARLGEHVSPPLARSLWAEALEQPVPELRSVALVRLIEAGSMEWAKVDLATLLADEATGASVALALARTGETEALIAVLEDSGAPLTARQRAALGLKAEGSAKAISVLARLLAAEPESTLAREVSKWID